MRGSKAPLPSIPCLRRFSLIVLVLAAIRGTHTQEQQLQPNNNGLVKAAFNTEPFTLGVSHRQNVCNRYDAYRNGTVALKDALEGFALRPVFNVGNFFPYSLETGIDEDNPGILVDILDMLAARARFTWRDSFAVEQFPPPDGLTFTDMLIWEVETYDIAVDWWDRSPARMALGVTFLEPWLDGSIILIEKVVHTSQDANEIDLDNFLKPFETSVWLLIAATIVLSSVVYQFIEYLHGDHNGRTGWEWFSDNLYLSAINFSQNFEFAPTSLGGRVFAVGMTLWALLITATYTANLASLLVVYQQPPVLIESIEQAVLHKIPICTWAETQSDVYIKHEYPRANLKPKNTQLEAYQALRNGECKLFASQKDQWFTVKHDSRYNPNCDLEWVGREVAHFASGFAVNADAGYKCSSLIRDVLNVHMLELINDGILELLKEQFRRKAREEYPLDCGGSSNNQNSNGGGGGGGDDAAARRRMLEWSDATTMDSSPGAAAVDGGGGDGGGGGAIAEKRRRELKSGGTGSTNPPDSTTSGSSSSGGGGHQTVSSLTLPQMFGTFVLHWSFLGLAVLISALTTVYQYWSGHLDRYVHETTTGKGGKGGGMMESAPMASGSNLSFYSIPESATAGAETAAAADFDWAGKYAQMTVKEKLIADAVFGRTTNKTTLVGGDSESREVCGDPRIP